MSLLPPGPFTSLRTSWSISMKKSVWTWMTPWRMQRPLNNSGRKLHNTQRLHSSSIWYEHV